MLLRGESRRHAELPDAFMLQLPKAEGPTPCWALMLRIDQGKTNQFGKVQYGVAVQHAEPLRCALGQLACYFFYRWNVVGEPHPTFRRRQDWYPIRMLKGQDPRKPVSYDTQLKWTNDAFSAIGVCSSNKTNLGRGQGAQHAELAGVGEDQIWRAGRWSHDALAGCYLPKIPRAMVQPPPSLVGAVAGLVPRQSAPAGRCRGGELRPGQGR
jgi:Centromere DNA-binding protein complex CBF3 subunit, domain 2